MKLHELKIKHKYYIEVEDGTKMFELRKNDRDYRVGDLIRFIEVKKECNNDYGVYVDRLIEKDDLYRITYVLKNVPEYGLDKDYCILGIKKLEIK